MDGFSVKELNEAIEKAKSIGIAVGEHHGIDDMAAALSLFLSLKNFGANVGISSPVEPIVELSSLVGIDKVKNNFESHDGSLVVSFPYQEGEIEKISYTMEEGLLNIVVKPSEAGLSFSEKDVIFKRIGEQPDLLIVIGTPRLSDLGGLFNPEKLKDSTVVNIDNKNENQGYGDIAMASVKASSVSELVADIILSLNLPMDQDSAQNLMYGLVFATDNFQKPTSSPLAFEIGSILMKKGAIRKNLAKRETPREEFAPFIQKARDIAQGGKPNFSGRVQGRRDRKNNKKIIRKQSQDQNLPTKEEDDWLTSKIYKGPTEI